MLNERDSFHIHVYFKYMDAKQWSNREAYGKKATQTVCELII